MVCHTWIYDVISLQENGSKLFSAFHRQLFPISVVFFFFSGSCLSLLTLIGAENEAVI